MNKIKIVYHKNCTDGMMAAYCAFLHFCNSCVPIELPVITDNRAIYNNIEFIAINPRESPEIDDVENSEIYVFDVTMPRDYLLYLHSKCKKIEVHDHHKTNLEELQGLSFCTFDMNESGASLSWKKWNPNKEAPWYIKYAKDRDLWLHELPNTHEVNAFLLSLDFTFHDYNNILNFELYQVIDFGTSILRQKNKDINSALKNFTITDFDTGEFVYKIALLNSNANQSELGNIMAAKNAVDFAVVYYIGYTEQDEKQPYAQLSLRSIGDFDVSAVAKKIGGGGHKNASGARVPLTVFKNCLKKGIFI